MSVLKIEEGEKIISGLVEDVRQRYNVGKYNLKEQSGYVERVCDKCNIDNMLFASDNGFGYEHINLSSLGIPEPVHHASILGFGTENGPMWYIVDETYGQFFENLVFRNYMVLNYREFSEELLNKGFIRCNLANMMSYINGFALSGAFTDEIEVDEVYRKVQELLSYQGIVNREVDEKISRLVELLRLRKEVLESADRESDSFSRK